MSAELTGWTTDARVLVGTAGHWLRWCTRNDPGFEPGERQVRLEDTNGVLLGIIADAPGYGDPIDSNIVAAALISGTVAALIERDVNERAQQASGVPDAKVMRLLSGVEPADETPEDER